MSGDHRRHVDHCLNCGAPTPGAYCAACGQEAVDAAVTFRDQMAHFFEEVFSVEARLLQTVKTLFLRPGELTRAYNAGQRVRFVTPLKTYLFSGAAFFLILSISAARAPKPGPRHDGNGKVDGYGFTFGPPAAPGVHVTRGTETPDAGASHEYSVQTPEEFDEWLRSSDDAKGIPAFIQPHMRSLIKSPQGFVGALVDMISKASIVLVPIHALILKLLYWRRRGPRRLYGEHIVFSLHLHSFAYLIFGLSTLLGLFASNAAGSVADSIAILGGGAYSVAAARTAYGEGVVRSALKMTVAGAAYAIALVTVVSLAFAVVFFTT